MLRNSPPKGSISFGYKLKEKEIVFHVADTGSGISDDKIDKIFDRFIMANNQVQGTGLGLSISKIIVEKLGGKIAVQSKIGNRDHIHFYIALHFGKRRYEMGGKTYTGFH